MNAPVNLQNPIQQWEREIWTPEPLFKDETVFCVACGPSLTPEIAEKLRGHKVIAVNNAIYEVPFADVLFFTDAGWFESFNEDNKRDAQFQGWPGNDVWPRRTFLEGFPGLIVTLAPVAKRVLDDPSNPYPMARKPRVLRVKSCGTPTHPPSRPNQSGYEIGFPRVGSPEFGGGRTSGHSAIGLAVAMGAKRICLVAYDMRLVEGREHFHNDYRGGRDLTIYEKEFVPSFAGWNAAAQASGVEILNCTPGSAVTEFPFANLDGVLNDDCIIAR